MTPIFLIKPIRSILRIKKQIGHLPTKSFNGYATGVSLLCFALVIQIVSLMSISMMETGYLIAMDHQNEVDLAILSYVRSMIETNVWVKRCHLDPEKAILSQDIHIAHYQVHMEDKDTWIECTYQKKTRTIEMKVYYDGSGIIAMDVDSH